MGDIHGSVEPIKAFLKRLPHKPTEDDVLILLGDVGFHYFLDERDDRVKAEANSLGIKLFCIRGNHEQRPEIVSYIKEGEDVYKRQEERRWTHGKYYKTR